MATTKKRVNITLSPEMEQAIGELARREKVPQATKISELLRLALEIEEDELLDRIASEREAESNEFVPHDEAWL